MTRTGLLVLALALPACVVGDAFDFGSGDQLPRSQSFLGNGALSGPHYDLNIIGVPT